MDRKKRARTEEVAAARARPVTTPAGRGDDADAAPSPVRKAPVPDDAAADGEPAAAAAAEESGGPGGVEDGEEEDEQVERFYALLANIRALRGLLPPPPDVAPSSSCGAGAGATSRKRLRAAEPPWRPAFRMEDFEEPATPPSKRKRTEGGEDGADGESATGGARPAVAPSLSHAAVRSADSGRCKN